MNSGKMNLNSNNNNCSNINDYYKKLFLNNNIGMSNKLNTKLHENIVQNTNKKIERLQNKLEKFEPAEYKKYFSSEDESLQQENLKSKDQKLQQENLKDEEKIKLSKVCQQNEKNDIEQLKYLFEQFKYQLDESENPNKNIYIDPKKEVQDQSSMISQLKAEYYKEFNSIQNEIKYLLK